MGNLYKTVPKFDEFCRCCCLPLLPQLACTILATLERPSSPALYDILLYFSGGKERKRPELTSPQTFSYERHFGTVGLGQIVNIIDDKNRGSAIGRAASETSASNGGGSGVIRERDGSDVQVSEHTG